MEIGFISSAQDKALVARGLRATSSNTSTAASSLYVHLQEVHIYSVGSHSRDTASFSARSNRKTSPSLDVQHASPLAPLRERDAQALDELFGHERIHEITLDIHRYLARMYPEPCWEDEPYEFLRGYI